jgi:hypothetical protein
MKLASQDRIADAHVAYQTVGLLGVADLLARCLSIIAILRVPMTVTENGDDTGVSIGASAVTSILLYKEISVDTNPATRTQTLKWGQECRETGREPEENGPTPQKPT